MQTKEENQSLGRKFAVFLLGLCLIQSGVAMQLRLNIGSDPFTVFTQGLALRLHITAGMSNRIITIVLAAILLFLDRTYLKAGTLISILFAGTIMDFMYRLYEPIPIGGCSYLVKCLLFLVALIPIAIGIPMIKLGSLGVAPNDCVYFALEDRLKRPYSQVRMACDAIYFAAGILFGGIIGAGTILCLVCLGPMTGYTFPRVEKAVNFFFSMKHTQWSINRSRT